MSEVKYGYVDADNKLIFIAVCIEGDTETCDRIKNDVGASEYHLMQENALYMPETAFWTGTQFRPYSPFASWVWNDEDKKWEPPLACPSDAPENYRYEWEESSVSWVLVEIDVIED